MMFIYKTAKFAPVWTTLLKVRVTFVHQTLTEHAISHQHIVPSAGCPQKGINKKIFILTCSLLQFTVFEFS